MDVTTSALSVSSIRTVVFMTGCNASCGPRRYTFPRSSRFARVTAGAKRPKHLQDTLPLTQTEPVRKIPRFPLAFCRSPATPLVCSTRWGARFGLLQQHVPRDLHLAVVLHQFLVGVE